ncbi:MAG: hypothetical protein ACREBS_00635 [Nitrososphaerales archaeon]
MKNLNIEGIAQKDLDQSMNKIDEFQQWARLEKVDRWAFRAALLKALYDDAEEYFASTNGNYRELAAFDNGVATALESLKSGGKKTS